MKKKFKLFATIGSLALAVCMMTIGVLAATQVSFSVTSNVSFTTDKVYVDVTGKVDYGATASRQSKNFTGKNYTGTAGDAAATNMVLTAGTGLTQEDITGTTVKFGSLAFAEEKGNTIVYTFTITNSGANECHVKITPTNGIASADNVTATPNVSGDITAVDGSEALAKGESVTYTYTLTITDISKTVTPGDVSFAFVMQSGAID